MRNIMSGKYSINSALMDIEAFTLEDLRRKPKKTPQTLKLVSCMGNGVDLKPVPEGLEVLGAATMAVDIDGTLTEVTFEDVVIHNRVTQTTRVIPANVLVALYDLV